jgi:hypothetical protein
MQRRKCMRFCAVLLYLIFVLHRQQTCCRKAWRYQKGNQKTKFEERQIIQWPKGKGQIIWHWLHPWPHTMQLLKSSLYLFQFFADTNLIDHTCILTCTNTTCIVDKTVYVTWHLVSSWIWWNCMVWLGLSLHYKKKWHIQSDHCLVRGLTGNSFLL